MTNSTNKQPGNFLWQFRKGPKPEEIAENSKKQNNSLCISKKTIIVIFIMMLMCIILGIIGLYKILSSADSKSYLGYALLLLAACIFLFLIIYLFWLLDLICNSISKSYFEVPIFDYDYEITATNLGLRIQSGNIITFLQFLCTMHYYSPNKILLDDGSDVACIIIDKDNKEDQELLKHLKSCKGISYVLHD